MELRKSIQSDKSFKDLHEPEEEARILLEEPNLALPQPPELEIQEASASINVLFFKRLFRLMKFSGTSFLSLPHLNLWQVILLSLFMSMSSAITADWSGKVIGTLTKAEEVWDMLPMGLLLYSSVSLTRAINLFLLDLLGWQWRKNITEKLNNSYFCGANPFLINYCKSTLIDNPDQRIVADIKSLCDNLSMIAVNGIQGLTEVVILTYSIYLVLGWPSILMVHLPAILFFVVYKFVLAKIAFYTFKQDQLEGDFRYFHARIRDYAESIAFYHGEDMERQNCEKAFKEVIQNKKYLARWNTIFKFINFMNRWVPEIGVFFGTALMLWNENLSHSELTRLITTVQSNSFTAMGAVQNVFALGGPLGIVAGSVGRVAQLLEMCDHLNQTQLSRTHNLHDSEDVIKLNHVTCHTPQQTTLVRDLSIKISANNNLLIMGPSGCGKSSLLRSFAGLWQFEGDIYRPPKIGQKGLLYLTQKPYLTNDTLRSQIIFPDKSQKYDVHDDYLVEILRKTNIEYILKQRGGWDVVHKWSEVLSPGEQQRIMFARLFYHQPTFAVLDEATSALDTENENVMYEECLRLGMTLVSVGHRESLKKFHNQLLVFDGNGSFMVSEITKEQRSSAVEEENWQRIKSKKGTLDLTDPEIVEFNSILPHLETSENHVYVSRAWKLLKIAHGKTLWSKNTFLLLVFTISAIASALCTGGLPYALRMLSNAIISGELTTFYVYSVIAFIIATVMSIIAGLVAACSYYLGIYYRERLTQFIHILYFHQDVTLQLNTAHLDIDNPDQRVATDIDNFTSGFDTFGIMNILQIVFLAAPVPLVCLFVVVEYAGWVVVPLILVSIGLVFSLSVPFVSFIGRLEYNLSEAEGNFRYKHIEIRENAEMIGFYGNVGIQRERNTVSDTFGKVLDAQWAAVKGRALFNLYYHIAVGNARLISLIIVLAAIAVSGGLSVIPKNQIYGLVSQSSSLAQTAILNSLSIFSIMGPLGQNNGHMIRVIQMLERMNQLTTEKNSLKVRNRKRGSHIEFDGAVCVTPTGKKLNQFGVSVKVPPKEGLIIMGPSGSGKSSLLRTLGGLWPLIEGTVISPEETFFLPQKAYMVIGTLRDQLIYPNTINDLLCSDEELVINMNRAQIGYLLKRYTLDSKEIWNSVLSPGEQQRLSLARLFYHHPPYAILDESTSALDAENEDAMYNMCAQLGIGYVSVGHRESLVHHHNILLRLDGRGGYDLYKKEQTHI